MKQLAAILAAVLVTGIGAAASAQSTISITQPGNGKAAASAPLTYAVMNSSGASIMLSTSGGCGSYQRPMKPAAHLYATCAVTDGTSTIAATSYPAKKLLCAEHITRQAGINYTAFEGATACRASESLNHVEIVVVPTPGIIAPRR